ncbi:MAG: FAD-dependent monooxygenase [Myxococcales bacterium]|nr:FAD-dependent monooxygenase [Myxococcales bacterium]
MATQVEIFVPLTELAKDEDGAVHHDPEQALWALAMLEASRRAGIPKVGGVRLLRKSLDARKGFPIGYRLQVEVFPEGAELPPSCSRIELHRPGGQGSWPLLQGGSLRLPKVAPLTVKKRVVIVGSGPAGTLCAKRLCEAGVEVILLEQGQPVQPRRHDLAQLVRGALVEDSNYCFGEGGAGTFSDGKLYTRSKDRAAIGETLLTLVEHGADPRISVESRPHIGSNRLPKILLGLRADLTARGVVYHFGEKVVDLLRSPSGKLLGVRCQSGMEVLADAVVLAVGHSARSIYELMVAQHIVVERKAFAIGARIEHPQPLIDRIQYGPAAEHPALPAAFYQVAASVGDRGVYSFCMCPGGWVVPSATEPGGLCVNGMSLKRRDSPLANSALVVSVEDRDVVPFERFAGDPLAGMFFQRAIEQAAFVAGGGRFVAPAQKLTDFLAGRPSTELLPTTYRPGIASGNLAALLPPFVSESLRQAVGRFQRTMPGFVSPQAQLVGVETRTSSPLRIVRGEDLQSPSLPGLFPVGEGAGYAGGIVSAAIDGLRSADAVLSYLRG